MTPSLDNIWRGYCLAIHHRPGQMRTTWISYWRHFPEWKQPGEKVESWRAPILPFTDLTCCQRTASTVCKSHEAEGKKRHIKPGLNSILHVSADPLTMFGHTVQHSFSCQNIVKCICLSSRLLYKSVIILCLGNPAPLTWDGVDLIDIEAVD